MMYLGVYGEVLMQSSTKLRLLIPGFGVPAATTMIVNALFLIKPLLLDRIGDCSVCTQTRSMFLQTATGFVQPIILSCLLQMSLAANTKNPILPKPKYFGQFLKFHADVLKKTGRLSLSMWSVNLVLACFIANRQTLEAQLIMKNLRQKISEGHPSIMY